MPYIYWSKNENIRIRTNDISIYLKLCNESNICEKERIILKEYLDYITECKSRKHLEKYQEYYNKILNQLKSHNLSQEILLKFTTF